MKAFCLIILVGSLSFLANGQVAGNPKLVKDIVSDNSSKQTSYHGIEFQGKYFFDHLGDLWSSDGTETGTTIVKDLNPLKGSFIAAMKVMNNHLFFVANDSTHGYELWISDGTSNGTYLLKDINPSSDSAGVLPFYNSDPLPELNGELFFYADDGVHGVELWKTDGTSTGTKMVKNIHPSGDALEFANWYQTPTEKVLLISDGKRIYFAASDSIHGEELWVSDGTEQGTFMVKNIDTTEAYGVSPINLMLLNNLVIFYGHQFSLDPGLYVSDGTESGTHRLASARSFGTNEYAVLNNKLFFYSNWSTSSDGLWTSDGTPSGTHLVHPCLYPNTSIFPYRRAIAHYSGKVYFNAEGKLWQTDGTAQGTNILLDHSPVNANVFFLTQFGDYLYFRGVDTNGRSEMYVTNGADIELKTLDDYDFTTKSSLVRRYMATGVVTKVGVKLFFWNTYYSQTGNALYTMSLFPEDIKESNVKPELKLWPNPAANELYFRCAGVKAISIYDLTGRNVFNSIATGNSADVVNVESLRPGTYYFSVETEEGPATRLFVKM